MGKKKHHREGGKGLNSKIDEAAAYEPIVLKAKKGGIIAMKQGYYKISMINSKGDEFSYLHWCSTQSDIERLITREKNGGGTNLKAEYMYAKTPEIMEFRNKA